MCFPAIEHSHFVSSRDGIANLIGPGKSGAAQNQNAERFILFGGGEPKWREHESSASRGRELDKLSARNHRFA
jgi:hypothetical protein